MKVTSFFTLLWIALLSQSCTAQPIEPELFYFSSIRVNGQQSGGFYANNIAGKPTVELAFSAPLAKESAPEYIKLFERATAQLVESSLQFSRGDSVVTLQPKQDLKSATAYQVVIYPDLKSKKLTTLQNLHRFGMTTKVDPADKFPRISDDELLTLVQKQTFNYFWDFGHPVSGLARERNTSGDIVTSGGTGFGILAMVVAVERGFISREQAIERLTKMTDFLKNKTKTYHGVFPHWLNGATGETVAFSTYDDGGDLVETSFLMQGLLTARHYFNQSDAKETAVRKTITELWEAVEWDWHTKGENVLYWHWSANHGWRMNHKIQGWNECLITYFLAAASPTHPISKDVYDQGWARQMKNGKTFEGVTLPLGFDFGGPLFFSHYSFLALSPKGLKDSYADYWTQNRAHTEINYRYCVRNPRNYAGYSANCWGLTASDSHNGYAAHSPTEDLGVIFPTAALSAFPYTPKESMDALHHFYYVLGDKIWGEYGFKDAFNLSNLWFADSYLAIDQGPIICMIENHRTGLLWNTFMSTPEAKKGKQVLGFE